MKTTFKPKESKKKLTKKQMKEAKEREMEARHNRNRVFGSIH